MFVIKTAAVFLLILILKVYATFPLLTLSIVATHAHKQKLETRDKPNSPAPRAISKATSRSAARQCAWDEDAADRAGVSLRGIEDVSASKRRAAKRARPPSRRTRGKSARSPPYPRHRWFPGEGTLQRRQEGSGGITGDPSPTDSHASPRAALTGAASAAVVSW